MKVEEIVSCFMGSIKRVERWVERETTPSKDFLYGYLSNANTILINLYHADDIEKYKIRSATAREKKQFIKHIKWTATAFDVAVNKLYGITIEQDKEYTSHIKPWGILEFMDKKYPVYADDPGQCDYIEVDGIQYSGGTYNFNPEPTFMVYILENEAEKIRSKIKGE